MINYINEQFTALSSVIGGAADLGRVGGNLGSIGKIGGDLGGTVGKIGDDLGGTIGKIGDDLGGTIGKIGDDLGGTVGKIGDNLGGTVGKIGDDLGGTGGKISDDTLKTVDDAIKNSPDELVTKSKSILAQAGESATNFAKKHPILTGVGLTAGGVAIYAAATNKSFDQAVKELTNSVGTNVIRPISESVSNLAGTVLQVGVRDVGQPFFGPIWDAIKEFFNAFKTPLIIIGVILALIIIYKIYNFVNN
jgi:hypothetical protein